MLRFIKKYWLIILIGLTVVLFIIDKILETKQTPLTPTITGVANYRSLLPGKSTQQEVNNLLGAPLTEQGVGEKTIAEYPSSNQYRNHIVIFDNNVATIIKEKIISSEEKTADSITDKFGTAPYVLYDQDPSAVFNLYVYPSNGIAYKGADDGTLLEVWYFNPMTLSEFISNWGEGYSEKKPTGQNPY